MTPASEGRRSSGWTALWRLASAQRGRITLLALVSFAAAMVEAAFLVLVTGLLLAISSGRDVIGPVAGHEVPIGTAVAAAGVGLVLRFVFNMVTVRQSAAVSAAVLAGSRRLGRHRRGDSGHR